MVASYAKTLKVVASYANPIWKPPMQGWQCASSGAGVARSIPLPGPRQTRVGAGAATPPFEAPNTPPKRHKAPPGAPRQRKHIWQAGDDRTTLIKRRGHDAVSRAQLLQTPDEAVAGVED